MRTHVVLLACLTSACLAEDNHYFGVHASDGAATTAITTSGDPPATGDTTRAATSDGDADAATSSPPATDTGPDTEATTGAPECQPDEVRKCYDGPPGTLGVGACRPGVSTCADGQWGPCAGQVMPAQENCMTVEDEDCDGATDPCMAECDPGDEEPCYTGPPGTQDVGVCKAGLRECVDGEWSACAGEVVPSMESCQDPGLDEDCDLVADEDCPECMPGDKKECYTGPDGSEGVGICEAGLALCDDAGHYGPCEGQVLPVREDCNSPLDEDCDGDPDC